MRFAGVSGSQQEGREFDRVIREMRRSLTLLASAAEDQIAYVEGLRAHHDELALEFDDEYVMLPQLEADEYVSHDQAEALRAVDRQLTRMSGHVNSAIWTDEGLRGAPEWEVVRRLARAALELMPAE